MAKEKIDFVSVENEILDGIMKSGDKKQRRAKQYGRVNLAFDKAILGDIKIIAKIEDRTINDICSDFINKSVIKYKSEKGDKFEAAKKFFM